MLAFNLLFHKMYVNCCMPKNMVASKYIYKSIKMEDNEHLNRNGITIGSTSCQSWFFPLTFSWSRITYCSRIKYNPIVNLLFLNRCAVTFLIQMHFYTFSNGT
jgi:hypothetical protein